MSSFEHFQLCSRIQYSTVSDMLKLILLFLHVRFNAGGLVVRGCGYLGDGHTLGAAVYDGTDNIYFLGGYGTNLTTRLDSVIRLNVDTYESRTVGRFPVSIDSGATEIDGNGDIFFFGGFTGIYQETEIYKLTDEYTTPEVVNHLDYVGSFISAVSTGSNSIFLLGGYRGYNFQNIYLYNTTANTLDVVGRLPQAMYSLAPVYDGNNIFIFGGNVEPNGGIHSRILKFDPVAFTIETLNVTTNKNHQIHTAQYIGNNQSILIGYNQSGAAYFTRFHHNSETLEDLQVNTTLLTQLYYPTSAFVPKNRKLYFHGDKLANGEYSHSVYCLEFPEDPEITCPSEGLHFLPHPSNCSLYYICADGKLVRLETKIVGLRPYLYN